MAAKLYFESPRQRAAHLARFGSGATAQLPVLLTLWQSHLSRWAPTAHTPLLIGGIFRCNWGWAGGRACSRGVTTQNCPCLIITHQQFTMNPNLTPTLTPARLNPAKNNRAQWLNATIIAVAVAQPALRAMSRRSCRPGGRELRRLVSPILRSQVGCAIHDPWLTREANARQPLKTSGTAERSGSPAPQGELHSATANMPGPVVRVRLQMRLPRRRSGCG